VAQRINEHLAALSKGGMNNPKEESFIADGDGRGRAWDDLHDC
jgi:hypothetical protein